MHKKYIKQFLRTFMGGCTFGFGRIQIPNTNSAKKIPVITAHDLRNSWITVETQFGSNEILFYPHKINNGCDRRDGDGDGDGNGMHNVVYFGGDIQDSTENMKNEDLFEDYKFYSLEETAILLKQKFPASNVIIIRPYLKNNSFSIFSNFLPMVDRTYGQSMPNALKGNACSHLVAILQHLNCFRYPIHIIGFSRGVNVLTQLVTECNLNSNMNHKIHIQNGMVFRGNISIKNSNNNTANNVKNKIPIAKERDEDEDEDKEMNTINKSAVALFANTQSMYFLDGGNGNYRFTHPNNQPNIECLSNVLSANANANMNTNTNTNNLFAFHLYGTHRQWNDTRRPWIGEEKNEFIRLLKLFQYSCLDSNGNPDENANTNTNVQPFYAIHEKLYKENELDAFLRENEPSLFDNGDNDRQAGNNSHKSQQWKLPLYLHFELLRYFNACSSFE